MELLERYRPLFVIGRGGMGKVEAAVEEGALGTRVVALKRLLPHVRDRRHVDMFLREARLAALLNHKNVVHALAYGEHDGELLFAMEYVEGETLASLLEKQQSTRTLLPVEVSAYILAELCEGLHAAHELRDVSGSQLGVVHRDVSPHNIMLSYSGDVKLLDFGVAKLEGTHLTKTGEVKGKTAYMSPEQASGDPLDRRSDLYSVGAILFELVAGRRMWSGETDLDFLRQLALAEPALLADANVGAPPELCELQRRLVAKDRDERPATALDAARTLRQFASRSGEPPRRLLARILEDKCGTEALAKRRRLEEALARAVDDPDPKSGEPLAIIAPANAQRTSRVSPWLYGAVGAALATAAVLLVAKTNRPAAVPAPSATASFAAAGASTPNPTATTTVTEPAVVDSAARAAETAASPGPHVRYGRPHPAATQKPHEPVTPPPPSSTAHPRPVIDVDPNPI